MEKLDYEKLAEDNRRLTLEIAKDYGRMKREMEEWKYRQKHIHDEMAEIKSMFVAFMVKSGITEIIKINSKPQEAQKCEKCGK